MSEITYKDEQDVFDQIKATVRAQCRKEAEEQGIKFNPQSRYVRRRVQEAVDESLDELGYFHPPAPAEEKREPWKPYAQWVRERIKAELAESPDELGHVDVPRSVQR